jgi:hypothetical protein
LWLKFSNNRTQKMLILAGFGMVGYHRDLQSPGWHLPIGMSWRLMMDRAIYISYDLLQRGLSETPRERTIRPDP